MMKRRHGPILNIFFILVSSLGAMAAETNLLQRFEQEVLQEMRDWKISGLDVVLIDDQTTVYSRRFGEVRSHHVFRCGSISKLFAAVAVMQQVEQNRLDLDQPIERYVPEAVPVDPTPTPTLAPITLRHLLAHRSGLVREAPVGGYFDPSEPNFDDVMIGIHATVLPTAPGAKMRYSNVGPSVAGHAVARAAGVPFPEYQSTHVLGPLGMQRSAWLRKSLGPLRVIPSSMRIAQSDGTFQDGPAPVFDFGILPAANLFTTAEDLGLFVSMLAAGGRARNGATILKPETLDAMFTPQFTSDTNGFGLGFSIGSFQGRKSVGHSGAVYGFSSSLNFLPAEKLGVVILGNRDIVNGRIQKIANLGLHLLLERKLNEPAIQPPPSLRLSEAELAPFIGEYESQSFWAKVTIKDGELTADISTQPTRLRPIEPLIFLADSALHESARMIFERASEGSITGFKLAGQTYSRVPLDRPRIPDPWRKLLGSYGPRFIPLVISERNGHLYALTENMVDYRLAPLNMHVFEMPPGMYVNEHIVFFPDRQGYPSSLSLAGMVLRRR